jgi:hypothetical protein
MPECQNCESHVTEQYARVFTPTGVDDPRCCPNCMDKIRDGAEVRDARSPRSGNGSEPTQYDEDMANGGSA